MGYLRLVGEIRKPWVERYLGDGLALYCAAEEVKLSNDVREILKKTDPGCHGNEIWDKMGHNLTCMGNITEMIAPGRGFRGLGY